MKTDLDTMRELFEKLEYEYTTKKVGELTFLTIKESPKIAFSFFANGEMCSIYNDW